jgi:uncharacterized protein YjdB
MSRLDGPSASSDAAARRARPSWSRRLRLAALALPVSAAMLLSAACDNGPEVAATLQLSAPTTNLLVGQSVQITPTVKGKSGKVLSGRVVTYTSSAPTVAGVSADGTLTALAAGSAVITGTVDGVTARLDVIVAPVPVNRVQMSLDSVTLAALTTQQLSATPLDSAGHTLFNRTVAWASSDNTIATVSSSGLVTAVAAGTANVTATIEGKVGTVRVRVTPPAIASIDISPRTPIVNEGATVRFTATPKDAAGNPITGRTLTWTSSDVNVARVDSTGLATAVAQGVANILVTSGSVFGGTTITVRAVVVGSVDVTPDSATLQAAATVQLTATVKDTAGNVVTGKPVTWRSKDTTVVTVSATGLVTGVSQGTTYVVATSASQKDSARITVAPPPVASIQLRPAPVNLGLGQSGRVAVTLLDAGGHVTSAKITYSSGTPTVASVDTTGLIVGLVAPGLSNLVVSAGGKSVSTSINVVATTVASVTIDSTTLTLPVGGTFTLNPIPRDGSGNPLAGRTMSFTGSDNSVITVTNLGVVTAAGPGIAGVVMVSEGKSVTTTITVPAP